MMPVESPSVSEQGGPVCASPCSSGSPFAIIKMFSSSDLISLTHRGEAAKKTIFPGKTSEEGKQQKQMCFIREKTSWRGYSKQFHLTKVSIITSEKERKGRRGTIPK